MKNNYTSPYSLTPISELKIERESKINTLINNLKIGEVKDEAKFIETSERIKNSILLTPIVFGEPKFIDHEFEEIALTMQQQLIGGMSRNHYYHRVSFPFTGDREIFSYQPESFSYSSSDKGLIIPHSNNLTVNVDLPELNPDRAVSEGKNMLSMTMQFVSGNNASLQSWTVVVSQTIDEQLRVKREELIKIFGDKY